MLLRVQELVAFCLARIEPSYDGLGLGCSPVSERDRKISAPPFTLARNRKYRRQYCGPIFAKDPHNVTIGAVEQPEEIGSRWQDAPGNLDRLAKGEPRRLIPLICMYNRQDNQGAKDSNSTLAALGSLYRYGRLVLMGSTVAPVPINYMLIMINSLEIIGNFMYPHHAYLPLLALLRSGQLDTSAIIPKVFSLIDLPKAMEYAAKARSLECVVVTARPDRC